MKPGNAISSRINRMSARFQKIVKIGGYRQVIFNDQNMHTTIHNGDSKFLSTRCMKFSA